MLDPVSMLLLVVRKDAFSKVAARVPSHRGCSSFQRWWVLKLGGATDRTPLRPMTGVLLTTSWLVIVLIGNCCFLLPIVAGGCFSCLKVFCVL